MKNKTESMAVLLNQPPPHNLDAERVVLGACLRNANVIPEISERITSEKFYADPHQKVFAQIVENFQANKPTDVVAIAESLSGKQQLADVGAPFLAELFDDVLSTAIIGHYIDIVLETWKQRQIISICCESIQDAFNRRPSSETIVELTNTLTDINADADRASVTTYAEAAAVALEHIQRQVDIASGKIEATSDFQFGLTDVDENVKAAKSDLVVIAARPSIGKSTLLNHIADHNCDRGGIGIIFSIEMPDHQCAARLMACNAMVNGRAMRNGHLGEDDMNRLLMEFGRAHDRLLFFDDAKLTMSRVEAVCHRIKMQRGLDFVGIDYLQLLTPDDPRKPRQEQVAMMARACKNLARRLDVVVLALSQLNREAEKRDDKRPRVSELRESGAIENDADIILLLHRPEHYDAKNEPGKAEIIYPKVRNGAVGEQWVSFQKEFMKFGDLSHATPFSTAADIQNHDNYEF